MTAQFGAEIAMGRRQLYVTGRMLLRVNSTVYEDLAIPLHHNADR
jgi:hypothetical protein